MLMQPAISINIVADEETIRMICTTIGFVVMCWALPKIFAILREKKIV